MVFPTVVFPGALMACTGQLPLGAKHFMAAGFFPLIFSLFVGGVILFVTQCAHEHILLAVAGGGIGIVRVVVEC